MVEKPSAPSVTTLDISESIVSSTDALTVVSYDPSMTKICASITLNTLDQTLSNKNLLHPLSSESPHQKPSKNCTSPQTDKTAAPLPHQMVLEKEDARERNPNGKGSKTMSTEAFPNNFGKWTRNMTRNSRTFPSLLTTRSSTTTPPTTTLMANQVTPKIFEFSMEFQI